MFFVVVGGGGGLWEVEGGGGHVAANAELVFCFFFFCTRHWYLKCLSSFNEFVAVLGKAQNFCSSHSHFKPTCNFRSPHNPICILIIMTHVHVARESLLLRK
jgi:hypothetical protein